MKTKLFQLLLIFVLLLSLLAACAAQPTVTVVGGADKDAVLAYAEPMADGLLAGLNAGDYAAFSKDFDDAMLKALPESSFANLQAATTGKYGKYLSRQLKSVEEVGEYYRLIYSGQFEKYQNLTVLITFEKAEPHKVAGLFFTEKQ